MIEPVRAELSSSALSSARDANLKSAQPEMVTRASKCVSDLGHGSELEYKVRVRLYWLGTTSNIHH